MRLPEALRPRVEDYKPFTPGLDLPSWFQDDLKAIDRNLHLVYHPYRTMWDDIINEYEGELENPRYTIHKEFGVLNFGFVLTNKDGFPTPDNTWHIWRLCYPHGWGHVIQVQDTHEYYLKLLTKRLYLGDRYSTKYGHKAWSRLNEEEAEAEKEKQQRDEEDLFGVVQKENEWLMKKAQDNLGRGVINATNPQKEQIISYPGQTHRSRVSRPLEDREGGLILPGD